LNKQEETSLVTKIRQDRIILLTALLSGVVAVVLLWFYLDKKEKMYGDTVPVLVAAADIEKGATFSQATLEVKEVPQQFVIPNAVGPEFITSILDARTIVTIPKGQQISWNFPEVAEVSERLSASLSKEGNFRAVTMSVDEVSGVAGHIHANDRVGVIGTFQMSGAKDETVSTKTKTILQCVTVLAVGTGGGRSIATPMGNMPRNYSGLEAYTSVTLKLTPQEAELLTFAENAGTLRLLLRNPDDLEVNEDIPQIDFSNLFDIEKKLTKEVRIRVHQESTR